ncbi:MAG: ATP-dependent DNA helicase [Acidimicrobiia bacterium]
MKPTPEQQKIIEHPLEPVRVTAGAGTGKTTTMALRLAHLVQKNGLEPEQALGITFTHKAAGELASRLREYLPEMAAHGREVEVATYHGFAHGLLREFGPMVGVPRGVQVITPGYVRQLLRDSLGAKPRTHLDLTIPGSRVAELVTLSSTVGDHLATVDLLRDHLTGDPAVDGPRLEMAEVIADYQTRKDRLGVLDYADLVVRAHRLLTEVPEVAARVRDRYRVVLLDEYQDTNPGQREMLRAIFGGGFPVTAVGDSDQTIYEWRGASPANFNRFPEHFPLASGKPSPSLDLSTNWRSAVSIIDVANAVRGRIVTRSPLERLNPRPKAPPGSVRTHWLHSAVEEARWIAAETERLHEDGLAWGDIAVLFRKHRQMGLVREAMEHRGIPVEVASLGGLLEVPEVADLHAWLRILGKPDDAPALIRLLLGASYRLGLGDLAPLAAWVRARSRSRDEDSPIGWAILEAIDDLESVEGLSREARRRLEGFRSRYRELLEIAQGVSLVELSRRVLDRTGAWPEVDALDGAARLSARLNLYRFLDLAEEWSPLEGAPSLQAFLEHLEVLQDENTSDELDTARISSEDAVVLITVHRAKGLEWPAVFLPALCKGTFPSGIRSYEDPRSRPEVMPRELRLDASDLPDLGEDPDERKAVLLGAHSDQEWRTAYVAVTRARDVLIATGAFWYTEKTAKEQSGLFAVIDQLADPALGRCEEPGDPPVTLRFDSERAAEPDPLFADGWRSALATAVTDRSAVENLAKEAGVRVAYDAAVDQLLLKLDGLPTPGDTSPTEPPFRTSVTGLVTLAGCPLRFYWTEVERLPRKPTPAARRGVEVHRKIELHNRGTVAFDEADETFYDAVDGYEGPVTSAYDKFLASRFAERLPLLVEAPFDLLVDGVRIAGRIDAVYEDEPGSWEVVDFKSGRPSDDPARRVQLEAYAVAAHEAGFGGGRAPDKTRVTFAYLGGDTLVEQSEVVDREWLAGARTHLAELVGVATGGVFPAAPAAPCRTCDFNRFCEAGTAWLAANA